jgi:hypothetical protein
VSPGNEASVYKVRDETILVRNIAGLLTLNGGTSADWFCWWVVDGIGWKLFRMTSCVVIALLKMLDELSIRVYYLNKQL